MKKMIGISFIFFLIMRLVPLYSQVCAPHVVYYQAPVLEDFENQQRDKEWVIGNTSPNCDRSVTAIKPVNGGPWALAVPQDKKKWCLGVKTGFTSKGYNFIEILPPVYKTSLYPNLQVLFPANLPNPGNERFIPIPGRCKSIDIWVAGRNYRYTLEIWLKDYDGFVYALDMGKIDFAGWRNLSKKIPNYIPQDEKYIPKEKPLKIIKLVLRADPDERADKLYVYFDHLKVITDVAIQRYDGFDMKDTW